MERKYKMKVLYVIANAGYADDVVDILRGAGATGATILNVRGEGAHHKIFLGITLDDEKEAILCVVDEASAEKAMADIKEKAGINTPIHCVCFTMPVKDMVGFNVAGN